MLELGSGTGELLAALKPREGVGIDISPGMVEVARKRFPHLEWIVGDAWVHARHRTGTEMRHGARPTEVSIAAGQTVLS